MNALISPELMAQIEADRKERAALVAKIWRDGLSYKDWLFDGSPIRSNIMIARFNNLDWESAWVDLGPSIAGNQGPYWHVPLKETWIDGELYDCGDTVHRLYPKVLGSKWAMLILHACYQSQSKAAMARGMEFTEEAIERAAEAICLWDGGEWNGVLGSRECSRNRYRDMARAALTATLCVKLKLTASASALPDDRSVSTRTLGCGEP